MTKQELLDHLWNASNGLSMGWQLANVKDEQQRNHLQAPITSGQDSILEVIRHLESPQCNR